MLDIDKLLALRAVAAHGSIAAAGRELGYTRSAVSQQISALERAAGMALMVRTGTTMVITPAGRRLLEHTERVLAELRAAESALHKESGEVAGELRIGIPFREGPALISSALAGVRRRHPDLRITLAATADDVGADEVRYGRLDLAFQSRYGPAQGPVDPGLRQYVLGHDPLRVCVPRDHRLADATSCPIAGLRDESWVIGPSTPLGRLVLGMCALAGFQPAVAATVSDVPAALGLVIAGWGITIAPELMPSGRDESNLSRVALDGVDVARFSTMMIREGEQEDPSIAVVVDAVLEASGVLTWEQ